MDVLSWLLCTFVICLVNAQAPQDPLQDFCRRYGHQTTVIDNTLYIDGGFVYANPISQFPDPVMNTGLLYDDLLLLTEGMPTQYDNLTKNSTVPDVAGGVLWADEVNKIFYLYGGQFSQVPQPFQLWGYDTILNQWNLSATPSTSVNRVSYGAGLSVSESALGFYYGGYLNNVTNPLWDAPQIATSNLIQYDMIGNSFTNNTGPDSVGRAEGTMIYIPASGAGVLVYFGGATFPFDNETAVSQPMDQIILYEIAEGKWYTQQATGDIPPDRRMFCGGATWPDDQSSYNIYIYGGFGFGENATGFDDVYILTMPAFEWIKWYPDTPDAKVYPHGSLTCNVINGTQMIVMGGNFTNSDMCDAPKIQGQHNLNLGKNDVTHAKWAGFQTNITGYDVPSEVLSVVGGGPQGAASLKSPTQGWSSPDLPVYFNQKASFAPRTPTRVIPTHTAAPPAPTHAPKKSTPIGAIVGGVVGGIAVILAIAIGLCLCLRKRKQRRLQGDTNRPHAAPPGMAIMPSPSPPYTSDPKFSVLASSNPGSPALTSSSPVHSYPHSSPYTTPPPQNQHSSYHPAHVPPPMPFQYDHDPNAPLPMNFAQMQQNNAYYPPPDASGSRPDAIRAASHEMPTVRSPEARDLGIIQPFPQRNYGSDPK